MKDWIRITDIPERAQDPIDLIAVALEELAICEALVLIHGPERGVARYHEAGGHVRKDEQGEVVIYGEVRS